MGASGAGGRMLRAAKCFVMRECDENENVMNFDGAKHGGHAIVYNARKEQNPTTVS